MKITRFALCVIFSLFSLGCAEYNNARPVSTTGIQKATANVKLNSNGRTNEQDNIVKRIELENQPGGTTIHISDSPIRFGDLVQKAETSKE